MNKSIIPIKPSPNKLMTPLLVLLVLCIASTQANWQRPSGISHADAFAQFNTFWNKGSGLSPAETAIRLANFIANAAKIDAWNANRTAPHHATFGYTKFADLSPAEFKQLLGFQPISPPNKRAQEQFNWPAYINGPKPPHSAPHAPTSAPLAPTSAPKAPTSAPSSVPTSTPTSAPTQPPTAPVTVPVSTPTSAPKAPTSAPLAPTSAPKAPTSTPTSAPTSGKAAIDWVARGMTTPVKDQGQCGSCWAHAATETVESANLIAGNPLTIGSPQQITSCAPSSVGSGCNGGDYHAALTWLKSTNGGLATNSCYPYSSATYKSGTTGTCTTGCASSPYLQVATVSYVKTTEDAIYTALTAAPVAIAVDASDAWQLYTGGVMAASSCGDATNHAVQLTGYSPDNGGYWIVRNSWGTGWGENGFIRLAYGTNTCNITTYPVTATATGTSTPSASIPAVPTAGSLGSEARVGDQSSSSGSNTGAIVGGVVGGIVGLLLIVGLIVAAVVYYPKAQSERI